MLISGPTCACARTHSLTHTEVGPAMGSWRGVFSSNQRCCHPMTQPARMTLEVGTVRGIHDRQPDGKGVGGHPAQPAQPASLAATTFAETGFSPTSNPTGCVPQVPGREGFLHVLLKVSLPAVSTLALLAAWAVTQKHPNRVYRANHSRAAARLTLTGSSK